VSHKDRLRVLFVGDVFGNPGRRFLRVALPALRRKYQVDVAIVNGENAAGGMGITEKTARELFSAGADVITTGNHVWKYGRDVLPALKSEPRLLRPANYPEGAPGSGHYVHEVGEGLKVAVLNLCGRVFMEPIECPFRTADLLVEELRKETPVIVVDFHAEATSEKQAMGWYLAGRVSAVVGTHTHVQTADERILPGGTAYITDVGMTGPRDGVIGMKRERIIERFLTQIPVRFEVAEGPSILNAVLVEVEPKTGRALGIKRIWLDEEAGGEATWAC